MLRFRALALSRMDSDVWRWDLCAVYFAHSDDSGGNWRPPLGHAERTAIAPGYERCGAGELVELFGSGTVTWMFTEGRTP